MKFVEVRVKKNTHEAWGLVRRATCWKRGIADQETAMPTQPRRSETDATQPVSPEAQPEPAKRKTGDPLVPRDTRPNPAEQNEPPVENV